MVNTEVGMIRRVPIIAATAAGVVVLAGAVGGGMVFAAGNDAPTPTPTTTTQNAAPPAPNQGGQQQLDNYLQKLAQKLGVSIDQLKSALKQTARDEIDQAVKDGKLTADQAQKLKDAIDRGPGIPFGPGVPGLRGPGPNGGKPGGPGPNGAMPMTPGNGPAFRGFMGVLGFAASDIATDLGITADQLRQELQSGQSLAAIAQAHGKTAQDIKDLLTKDADAAIQSQVASGKITQAQADTMKTAFASNVDNLISGKLPGKMPFGRPMHPRNPAGPGQPTTPGQPNGNGQLQPGSSPSGARIPVTS